MRRYYYLIASLPEIDDESIKKFPQLIKEWEEELHPADLPDLRFLLMRNDNKNLLKFLRARDGISLLDRISMHTPSVYSFEELENIYIGEYDGDKEVPYYFLKFIEEESEKKYSVRERENRLLELYYEAGIGHKNPFIRKMFLFKRDLKNIMLAINAKRHGFKMENVVLGDYDLPKRLFQAQEEDFGLSKEYPFVKNLIKKLEETQLVDLEREIDKALLDYLDEEESADFSFNYLLRYFIEMSQKYRYLNLSESEGEKALNEITEKIIQKSYSL